MAKVAAKKSANRKATSKKSTTKLSQLDAGLKAVAKAGKPMNCRDMVDVMAEQGLWTSHSPFVVVCCDA